MTVEARHADRSGSGKPAALWAIAAALSAVAVLLGMELSAGSSKAYAQAGGVAARDNVLVVAGQITGDSYGLYVVDIEKSTIGVYQWLPSARKLRLMAARNYTFDLQLDEYNTEPFPREIKRLVEEHSRLGAESRPN